MLKASGALSPGVCELKRPKQIQTALLSARALVEQGLDHLDVAGHSYARINQQRFTK
jgi:hypothetical protein